MVQRVLLMLALAGALAGCIRDGASNEEQAEAVAAALVVYEQKALSGEDFSNGPCIAEEVIDDWSVDIAHDPRQEIDDQPDNQCQYYRDGKTHHFVELTPEGELIRAR
jgi:hypothetical protein